MSNRILKSTVTLANRKHLLLHQGQVILIKIYFENKLIHEEDIFTFYVMWLTIPHISGNNKFSIFYRKNIGLKNKVS